MGNISNYLANALLDHIFGKGTYTPPTNIYVELSTTAPTDAGGNVTPPSGGGYARKQTAPSDWNASSVGSGRIIDNANAIEFAEATGDWGTLSYFTLWDAAEEGHFLGWGALTTPKAVGSGDTARFAAGDLDVSFTAS
jgi:hypothetical protein